jgi:probable F420-dependent oxidoreductase
MSNSLHVGCTLPTSGAAADPGALAGLGQAAEDLGFGSIWLSDHVVIPERMESTYPYGRWTTAADQPYLDPLAGLSFLAGKTSRVRLGTHVLILPYRHPLLTAKWITTLDNLSGGRVDLGIGVGWMREEFEALDSPSFDRRGAVTDEQVRIFQALWTAGVAGFEGEFYRFDRLGACPRPIQQPHPPIWVGGHTRPALRRAARLGNGWLPIGARPPANLPPEEIAQDLAILRAEAEKVGRDWRSIDVCFSTQLTFEPSDDTPRRPFSGSPEQIAADAQRYVDAGVRKFVFGFGPHPPADYERRMRHFVEHVHPALSTISLSAPQTPAAS